MKMEMFAEVGSISLLQDNAEKRFTKNTKSYIRMEKAAII